MFLRAFVSTFLLSAWIGVVSGRDRIFGPDGYGPGDPFRGHNSPAAYFNGRGRYGSGPRIFTPNDVNKARFINWHKEVDARMAHAVLASLAFVIFFPSGAIAVRLLPGKLAAAAHGFFQLFGFILYIVAVVLGIWMGVSLKFSQFNLLKSYHPIIGLILFALLFFQPIGGFLHHRNYKRTGQRSAPSYGHIWMGRILITLGMINGGLGLRTAANGTRGEYIAYGVVAGIIWLLWVVLAAVGERRRRRGARIAPVVTTKSGNSVANGHDTAARAPAAGEKTEYA